MVFDEIDFIFIHVPKTGGTTITNGVHKKLYGFNVNNDIRKDNNDKLGIKKITSKSHVTARAYKKALGSDYNRYYKVGFVRNPFSQIRSLFIQLSLMNTSVNKRFLPYKDMTFREFVIGRGDYSMKGNKDLIDQTKYFLDRRGESIVDDIFLFDKFNKGVRKISNKIGIYLNSNLRYRETSHIYKSNIEYNYTPEMVERVLDLYSHVYDFYKKVKKEHVLSKK